MFFQLAVLDLNSADIQGGGTGSKYIDLLLDISNVLLYYPIIVITATLELDLSSHMFPLL